MAERIAFLGGGQMAGSLISGLLAAGHDPQDLRACEPDAARAKWLREALKIEVQETRDGLCDGADALVIAVKPQVLAEALDGLRTPAGCVVVSIAAGATTEVLRSRLGNPAPIVRCMPNTPALLRHGVSALYAADDVTAPARALAEKILSSVGATCWIKDESLMDAVTAVSGSGPAYFFLLAEALREAGEALGLDPKTARLLAEKTCAGAGRMVETGSDVAELRANVTSKGGTTEAALARFEEQGFRKLVRSAVDAAARRGRELGAELSKG